MDIYLDCQHSFHRECASNSEKCAKDRKSNTLINPNSSKQRKSGKNPSSKLFSFIARRLENCVHVVVHISMFLRIEKE